MESQQFDRILLRVKLNIIFPAKGDARGNQGVSDSFAGGMPVSIKNDPIRPWEKELAPQLATAKHQLTIFLEAICYCLSVLASLFKRIGALFYPVVGK